MSEIVLEKVTKAFGRVKAVDNVSFRAEAGKFVVLLGPSGCGKSTVLRLVAGLEEPTEGRILIGGRDVTRLTPEKRKVSMVFQSYALFPHLSVAENIVFGLRVRGAPPARPGWTRRYRRRLRRGDALAHPPALVSRPEEAEEPGPFGSGLGFAAT